MPVTKAAIKTTIVDVDGAAIYIGTSTSTLAKMRMRGTGPVYIKFGRRVVYDVKDIDAWIVKNRRRSVNA